jgi:hypothetical protein
MEARMKYEELSDKAKRRALEWWASEDCWDYEVTLDDAKEYAPEGFHINDIVFSGFWSQGDGCAWRGSCNMAEWLDARTPTDPNLQHKYFVVRELMRDEWIDPYIYINSRGLGFRMYASDWKIARVYDEDSEIQSGVLKGASVLAVIEDGADALVADLIEVIVADAQDYADKIYDDLESDYNHHISEENLIEMADMNNWEFDEDGELV